MAHAAGILTARGGLASHAAVVARGWGIPAVVGAAAVEVSDGQVTIAGHALSAGDHISIDGSTGEVFAGDLVGSRQIAPEAATLLGWAEELGIEIARRDDGGPAAAAAEQAAAEPATRNGVLQSLLINGVMPAGQLASTMSADPAVVTALAGQLVADGLADVSSGGYHLTGTGRLAALDGFAADRDLLGIDHVIASLDAFRSLDHRMKDIVTAWQLRSAAGEPQLNDHSDVGYDAHVLDMLAELHAQTVTWMAPLAKAVTRFERYRIRLERALAAARGGDQRYVASPRVDSYHSVWFELHEDLIRLSGHQRADEEAGRACRMPGTAGLAVPRGRRLATRTFGLNRPGVTALGGNEGLRQADSHGATCGWRRLWLERGRGDRRSRHRLARDRKAQRRHCATGCP